MTDSMYIGAMCFIAGMTVMSAIYGALLAYKLKN
jgi:hypothetical protein